jgi:hypothetical protein
MIAMAARPAQEASAKTVSPVTPPAADFIDRHAGSDLAQQKSISRRFEQTVVGGDEFHHAARRHRQVAFRHQTGTAFAGGVLQDDEHPLRARGEIHRAADAAAFLALQFPVREIAAA